MVNEEVRNIGFGVGAMKGGKWECMNIVQRKEEMTYILCKILRSNDEIEEFAALHELADNSQL